MTDDLEQRVHALIYDADPEIPAAAVIALVRAAVADEIAAERDRASDSEPAGELSAATHGGYLRGLSIALAIVADPSRKEQK